MTFLSAMDRKRGRIRSRILHIQHWTWRLEVRGRGGLERLVENGDRFILCFWHGKYVPILPAMRGIDGCVFTSAGRSGDIIEQIASDFGFGCTQIPIRGGERSLRLMEAALSRFRAGAMAVDGPWGPYHRVKHGAVRLASSLGCLLVPVSVDARRKFVLKKRWDLIEFPYPFTRVCIVIGEPMAVPASLGPEGIAACSSQLGLALESLDARASGLVGEK